MLMKNEMYRVIRVSGQQQKQLWLDLKCNPVQIPFRCFSFNLYAILSQGPFFTMSICHKALMPQGLLVIGPFCHMALLSQGPYVAGRFEMRVCAPVQNSTKLTKISAFTQYHGIPWSQVLEKKCSSYYLSKLCFVWNYLRYKIVTFDI